MFLVKTKENYAHYKPDEIKTPEKGYIIIFLNMKGEWTTKNSYGIVKPTTDEEFRLLAAMAARTASTGLLF